MDKQIVTMIGSGDIFAVTDLDRRMAAALKMMLPYGDKLTDDNALALRVYGRLHRLDPLNGECWFIVTERTDDSGRVIKREEKGCAPGIKGKRKMAHEQLTEIDPQATFKCDHTVVDPASVGLDPERYAIVVRSELRDTISEGNYILNIIKLSQAGYTKEEVGNIVGKPPRWIGIGAVTKRETSYLKQPPYVVAKKRADSDAISQRFDLPIADQTYEDISAVDPVVGVDVVDGVISYVPIGEAEFAEPSPDETPAEPEAVPDEPKGPAAKSPFGPGGLTGGEPLPVKPDRPHKGKSEATLFGDMGF